MIPSRKKDQTIAVFSVVLLLIILRLIPTIDPIAKLINKYAPTQSLPNNQETNSELDTRLLVKDKEIESLRNELGFISKSNASYIPADVAFRTTDNFRLSIRINVGSDSGIKPNQPVLSSGFMIGIIESVEPASSSVILIGDPNLRIPVSIDGFEGLVRADAGGAILDKVASPKPINIGTPIITSGAGGLYPPGLIIGKVGVELKRNILGSYVIDRPANIEKNIIVIVIINQ